jgi:hypothetical protein
MTLNYTEHGENRVAQRNIPDREISRALSKGIWNNSAGKVWLVRYRNLHVIIGFNGAIVTAYRPRRIDN